MDNTLNKAIKKTSKAINSIWIFFSLLGVVLFITYFVNNKPANNSILGEQRSKTAAAESNGCKFTSPQNVFVPQTSALKTITQISSINYDLEVFTTELSKNEIPAIVFPNYSSSEELDKCLEETDLVLVLKDADTVQIYPTQILKHHLLINTSINGKPVLISRCNLCNNYTVYSREYKNQELLFGVSGLVYKNSDLIYDHKTESLWSQFDGIAKVGTFTNAALEKMDFELQTYAYARKVHPAAKFMNFDTGFRRNYFNDSFANFEEDNNIISPLTNTNSELQLKETVLGFKYADRNYAFSSKDLQYTRNYEVVVGASKLYLIPNGNTFNLVDSDNNKIPYTASYWYVWYDFYPDTVVLEAK